MLVEDLVSSIRSFPKTSDFHVLSIVSRTKVAYIGIVLHITFPEIILMWPTPI